MKYIKRICNELIDGLNSVPKEDIQVQLMLIALLAVTTVAIFIMK